MYGTRSNSHRFMCTSHLSNSTTKVSVIYKKKKNLIKKIVLVESQNDRLHEQLLLLCLHFLVDARFVVVQKKKKIFICYTSRPQILDSSLLAVGGEGENWMDWAHLMDRFRLSKSKSLAPCLLLIVTTPTTQRSGRSIQGQGWIRPELTEKERETFLNNNILICVRATSS